MDERAQGRQVLAHGEVEATAVHRFFPLRVGYVWTYAERVTTPAEEVLLERRVTFTVERDHRGEYQAFWDFQSGHTPLPNVRYRLVADGVQEAHLMGNTSYTGFVYLLKAPLQVGTAWTGLLGAAVRITAVAFTWQVPAGRFSPCVATLQEEEPTPEDRLETTRHFAFDVGLVWQQRRLFRGTALRRIDTMTLQKLPEPLRL
ncbi:MAG: hypothetical protein KatS3mg131_2563 [Candidatus Tectimicrobiota bacterium]|nr:MAG: hypothetical protein KatS3mg131_2563 [Candidatus Tectomicrobia bacterium]